MLGLALVIGAIFEVAALVFFVVADDPHMAFMLAITGLAMGLMTYILLYAQDTAESHAHIPEWKKFSGKHSPAAKMPPAGVHLPPPSIMPIAICAGAAVMFFGLAVNLPFFTLAHWPVRHLCRRRKGRRRADWCRSDGPRHHRLRGEIQS